MGTSEDLLLFHFFSMAIAQEGAQHFTGRKTVVFLGMRYFPPSSTSLLGIRTVPPATGYIRMDSCTHEIKQA